MLFSGYTKLSVNSSCPFRDLVIYDVNSLKSILEFRVIILDIAQIIVHLDDLGVLTISSSSDALTRIDL